MPSPIRLANDDMGAYIVKIGNVVLGADNTPNADYQQPSPVKITYSRRNNVKVHEIPYPKFKTVRTSVKTLYEVNINMKTFTRKYFEDVLELCEDVGPHLFDNGLKDMWVYITSYSFDQNAGWDNFHVEWNITMQEAND